MTPERWQHIKTLFDSALEKSGAERTAYLAAACAGDATLQAEVEDLLSAREECRGFLEFPTVEPGTSAFPEELRRSRIGPYELIRELGHGGMGTVYLAARADDEYRKEVAIKIIRRGMDTDSFISRFRNERQILAALVHPNIAAMLDGGTTDDGLPYFVMEYVEGEPIDRYCDARGLSISQRLQLFLAVCGAVQHAHANLVVHRDLKPGNILVTKGGIPKLLDFGLAKLLDPGAISLEQTATQQRFLTPAFASPEQIRGSAISTASDVYSLGVLLYLLLTAHRPYGSAASTFEELARAICEEEPLKPSASVARERGADKLRRGLSGDLDTIILKALCKEPERRYKSVEQLADDLHRHLEGRPVSARPRSVWYRSSKFISRHRIGVGATALIVLSLTGGFVETSRQRARAERRFNDVRKLASSLLFELHDAIRDLPGSTKARELVVKRAHAYLDVLASEAGGDASLQRDLASAYETLAEIQGGGNSNLGDTPGAVASYQKAVAIRLALTAGVTDLAASRALADTLGRLSSVRLVSGDGQGALSDSKRAVSILETLGARQRDSLTMKSLAASYCSLAHALNAAGDYLGALASRRKEVELFEALAAADPKDLTAKRNLALGYKYMGANLEVTGGAAEAREVLHKAVAIDAGRVKAEPTNTLAKLDLSFSYGSLAHNLMEAGDLTDALEFYRRALALREEVAAADVANAWARYSVARAQQSVGAVFMKMGAPAQALDSALKAAAILEGLVRGDPVSVHNRVTLATVYADLGDDEVEIARQKSTPGGRRASHWRSARAWFVKSDEIVQELVAQGKSLPTSYAIDLENGERNKRQIALCDDVLASTAGERSLPAGRR